MTTSPTPAIRAAHHAILAIVDGRGRRDPDAGHQAIRTGDILAVMPDCDAMVTDVSSVGLDWLYLRTERPIFLTDRHHDAERLRRRCRSAAAPTSSTRSTSPTLAALVASRLEHDEHHLARAAMRHHYFDDLQVGDSTGRFLDAVAELVALRDRLLGSDTLDREHRDHGPGRHLEHVLACAHG